MNTTAGLKNLSDVLCRKGPIREHQVQHRGKSNQTQKPNRRQQPSSPELLKILKGLLPPAAFTEEGYKDLYNTIKKASFSFPTHHKCCNQEERHELQPIAGVNTGSYGLVFRPQDGTKQLVSLARASGNGKGITKKGQIHISNQTSQITQDTGDQYAKKLLRRSSQLQHARFLQCDHLKITRGMNFTSLKCLLTYLNN